MLLTLDVGNSQIFGSVFRDDDCLFQFRKTSKEKTSSDEMGLFLKQVLRENAIDPAWIHFVAICSVVPDLIHSLKNCSIKYFHVEPFILKAGVKTGLKIYYRNPAEVGADRIANAIAGIHLFPRRDLIIVDFGTATTYCAVTSDKTYLGGVIIPGMRLAMESLVTGTAKLTSVEIIRPSELVGRSTAEAIQSGLYYGNLAIIKSFSQHIKDHYFSKSEEQPLIIGTGGFSRLFEGERIFDHLLPNLVHLGLKKAFELNQEE